MKSHTKNLRFNHNPLNLILGTRKKQGLRIGYMEAALDGFYLNCIETGVHPEKLSKLLSDKFHCTDAISSCQLIPIPHQRRRQSLLFYYGPLFTLYRKPKPV